jgi:hypothetical protein
VPKGNVIAAAVPFAFFAVRVAFGEPSFIVAIPAPVAGAFAALHCIRRVVYVIEFSHPIFALFQNSITLKQKINLQKMQKNATLWSSSLRSDKEILRAVALKRGASARREEVINLALA